MNDLEEVREIIFPSGDMADENGIVAISHELDTDYLYASYSNGIFPWPYEDDFIPWFCPEERAILEFDDLHISRSYRRQIKKSGFEFRINTAFEQVIIACSEIERKGQDGTWIFPQIIETYSEFHREGFAVSFETWNSNGELVGGMYGVCVNGNFAGESMFHLEPNASKFALVNAVKFLKSKGIGWMDVQQLTPLLESFGAKLIPRSEFLKKLHRKR